MSAGAGASEATEAVQLSLRLASVKAQQTSRVGWPAVTQAILYDPGQPRKQAVSCAESGSQK